VQLQVSYLTLSAVLVLKQKHTNKEPRPWPPLSPDETVWCNIKTLILLYWSNFWVLCLVRLFDCVFVNLLVCLISYLHTSLFLNLFVCFCVCLSVCLSVCLFVCLFLCLFGCWFMHWRLSTSFYQPYRFGYGKSILQNLSAAGCYTLHW